MGRRGMTEAEKDAAERKREAKKRRVNSATAQGAGAAADRRGSFRSRATSRSMPVPAAELAAAPRQEVAAALLAAAPQQEFAAAPQQEVAAAPQ